MESVRVEMGILVENGDDRDPSSTKRWRVWASKNEQFPWFVPLHPAAGLLVLHRKSLIVYSSVQRIISQDRWLRRRTRPGGHAARPGNARAGPGEDNIWMANKNDADDGLNVAGIIPESYPRIISQNVAGIPELGRCLWDFSPSLQKFGSLQFCTNF